jgi:ABC-type Fe3+/spermidine/putrescine transport system ATPase subunit
MSVNADNPVIVADNASKLFLDGTVVAFRQLSLAVKRDEILCIVGPSGCGKTTFLRCIAGLTEINTGSSWCANRSPARPTASPWCSSISACCRGRRFENAAFGLAMAEGGGGNQGASRITSTWSVSPASRSTTRINSRRHAQRVGLVRALAVDPSVLRWTSRSQRSTLRPAR